MTKQDVLDQVGREVQDTSAGFLTILSAAFDWVLIELAQRGAVGAANAKATFNFTDGVATYGTRTITGLSSPHYPAEIKRLVVPAWGVEGRLFRLPDDEFEDRSLYGGPTTEGRPTFWRLYPNETTLEVWPIPDGDHSGASYPCTIEFKKPLTALANNDNIVEIRYEDLPTLKAGLYLAGVKFRDETYQDRAEALAKFEQGVSLMRLNLFNAKYKGVDMRVRPGQFSH